MERGETVTVGLTGKHWREVTGEDIINVFWTTHSEKPLYYIFEETYNKDLTIERKTVPNSTAS